MIQNIMEMNYFIFKGGSFMKKLLLYLFVILLFASCGKDEKYINTAREYPLPGSMSIYGVKIKTVDETVNTILGMFYDKKGAEIEKEVTWNNDKDTIIAKYKEAEVRIEARRDKEGNPEFMIMDIIGTKGNKEITGLNLVQIDMAESAEQLRKELEESNAELQRELNRMAKQFK